MALSALDDPQREPDDAMLRDVLGASIDHWRQLVDSVATTYAPIDGVWNFAGAKFGWSMRLVRKKRVVLYLIPQVGHFLVGVVLGERAYRAAPDAGLPNTIIDMLDAARPYAEGRGIRVPVRAAADVDAVLRLAAVKMA